MIFLDNFMRHCRLTKNVIELESFEETLKYNIESIIRGWCILCFYYNFGENNITLGIKSARKDLNRIIKVISNYKIKCGRKDKIVRNVLINELCLNDSIHISNIIKRNFIHIGADDYRKQISEICASNINIICDMLCSCKNKNILGVPYLV